MSQPTLEDHFTEQAKRLEELTMATSIIQSKEKLTSELIAAQSEVYSIKNSLESMKTDLETTKSQNEGVERLSSLLDKLKGEISHMESNIPPKLLHDYASIQLSENKTLTDKKKRILTEKSTPNGRSVGSEMSDDVFLEDNYKENYVKNCKKILFNEPEVFHKIKLIGKDEFDLIPKYMIGRQTLDALNTFLDTINQILKAKYSLLALGQNGARKKGELDLYMNYRRQENADGKDKKDNDKVYFFTAEDYNRHTKTKLDKTKLNLLTVLRHCKRIREVRASKAIQYAVVASSQT